MAFENFKKLRQTTKHRSSSQREHRGCKKEPPDVEVSGGPEAITSLEKEYEEYRKLVVKHRGFSPSDQGKIWLKAIRTTRDSLSADKTKLRSTLEQWQETQTGNSVDFTIFRNHIKGIDM